MHIFASSKRMFISSKRISDKEDTITTEHNICCADVVKVTIRLPGNRIRVVEFKKGVEPMTIISDELLQRIVTSAFKAGERWGTAYQGWFTPKLGSNKKLMNNAIRAARKIVKRSNNKKG